jgi:hypothetical protein
MTRIEADLGGDMLAAPLLSPLSRQHIRRQWMPE